MRIPSLALAPIVFLAACGTKRTPTLANFGGETGPICVPANWQSTEATSVRIRVAALSGGLALCAVHDGQGIDCRAFDLAHGTLGAVVPNETSNHAIYVSEAEPVHEGFTIPPGASLFATAPDGSWAAAIGEKIWLLEKGQAAPSHALELMVADEATSIGNGPIDAILRGDRLYVRSADAGPYSYATAFGRDGTRLGHVPIGDYGGSFMALDRKRVAGSTWALETLTIFDGHGATSAITRAHAKVRCSEDELQNGLIGMTEELPRDCSADLVTIMKPYEDVELAAIGDQFLGVLHAGELGHLAFLSPKDLSIVAERPIAVCP